MRKTFISDAVDLPIIPLNRNQAVLNMIDNTPSSDGK